MIEITDKPISPEPLIAAVKTRGSGCVATYVGLIRDNSNGKKVASVTYQDLTGSAVKELQLIADEVEEMWPVENVGIVHRTGRLQVGDINLFVAIAAGHRGEGFAACQYVVDEFKRRLPTKKTEAYKD